jgi:hypothetical protein
MIAPHDQASFMTTTQSTQAADGTQQALDGPTLTTVGFIGYLHVICADLMSGVTVMN